MKLPKLYTDCATPEQRAAYATNQAKECRKNGDVKAANAWEKEARGARNAALNRDLNAIALTQTSLFNDDDCSSLPLFQQ